MEWPRPAEGTHLFMLGDEAVLYSHRAQELYSFNTAAALIWCSLELGKTRTALPPARDRSSNPIPIGIRESLGASSSGAPRGLRDKLHYDGLPHVRRREALHLRRRPALCRLLGIGPARALR